MRKTALFENKDCITFLDNAKTITDQVRSFLMLNYGMHPENLRRLQKDKNITERGVLEYKRAKNDRPRRELLSKEQAKVIYSVVKRGALKKSNRAYEYMCEEQGIGIDYSSPPISPMTLRHTYVLNMMRRFDFDLELVSAKAGCNKSTVIQNYLDLEDWQDIHKKKFQEPLDLSDYEFGVE